MYFTSSLKKIIVYQKNVHPCINICSLYIKNVRHVFKDYLVISKIVHRINKNVHHVLKMPVAFFEWFIICLKKFIYIKRFIVY